MAIENLYLDIIVAGSVGGFGLFLNNIRKGLNKLSGKVDLIDVKMTELDETVKTHTITVSEIVLCDNVMSRIDLKVQQSLEYLDRDDLVVRGFICKMGISAKEAIQWAIHNQLNISEGEIRAKYELLNIDIRDLLTETPAEFSVKVRPLLRDIAIHHINRVVAIATDELFNSKLDRFFTLTEQTVNETITSIIRTRIENHLKK